MPFLPFLELLLILTLLVLIATQMVWPALIGGKWFPLFRRKDLEGQRRAAEEDLNRAKQEAAISAINLETEYIKHVAHQPHKESE